MSSSEESYLAAVEGGGTTFVVSVARVIRSGDDESDDNLLQIGPAHLRIMHTATIPPKNSDTGEIPNFAPKQILDEACAFFAKHRPSSGKYSALGIATFGPAGVDPTQSSNYGTILGGSPKKEWRNVDLLTPIANACGLEGMEDSRVVGFDTDVNAPALAEFRHRSYLQQQQSQNISKPLTSLSYITIGTGVGVGLILNSHPIHGLLHPEGGHVAVQPLPGDDFKGYSWGVEKSPYGGLGTVEGVTSSVALTERYLQMDSTKDSTDGDTANAQAREVLSTLPDTHPIWEHASNAIANLCVSLLLLTSCQKIVLGGGIMKRTVLYDMVRQRVWKLLNGYLDSIDELSEESKLKDVIVESSWEEIGSGLVGAFALALDAHEKDSKIGEIEGNDPQSATVLPTKEKSVGKKRGDKDTMSDDEQRMFTSGVLAGIGLSFGCVLLSSIFGHGRGRK